MQLAFWVDRRLKYRTSKSERGEDDITNRILLCQPCNGKKSNTMTLTGLWRTNRRDGRVQDATKAKVVMNRAIDAASVSATNGAASEAMTCWRRFNRMEEIMVFPVKADLSESLNNVVNLLPDALRAVGERLTEEYDYRRDQRRMHNIVDAANLALPDIGENPTAPDDDWMTEWFDLASKRSYADWQKAMGKMLASEVNEPGAVPLRYFVDMARLDKQVLDEFAEYCGWYVTSLREIVRKGTRIPRYIGEANLIEHGALGRSVLISEAPITAKFLVTSINGEIIRTRNAECDLPIGNYWLTNFGKFVYELLDPKPPLSPELAPSLRELWKDYLYEGDTTA